MDLRDSIVRILVASDERATAGTGFVVTEEGHIATCAHVVNDAGSGPGGTVSLVFLTTEEKRDATVDAQYWTDPSAEDVAILCLSGQLPAGATTLPFGTSIDVKGRRFETFGFTKDKPIEGELSVGEIIGEVQEAGFPVLQLRSEEVTKGFSGAPLWQEKFGVVVGMVTSIKGTKKQKIDGKIIFLPSDPSWRGLTTAYATTVETIRGACSILALPDFCPYRGLEAFEDQHGDYYFGREVAVQELLQVLTERDFVAVVGVSGSGKSSLVRAGLKKGLRESSVPGLVELGERPPCIFKASSTPLLDLVVALSGLPTQTTESVTHSFGLRANALSEDPEARRQADAFLNKQPPEALARSLRECVGSEELLLIIDQFERLYTERQDESTRLRFIETLLASARVGVKVIVVLRADFYGLALQHPNLAHVIKDGQVTMLPMNDDELRRAIVEPAKAVFRSFQPELVQRLLTDVRGQAGNLPLLEFALTELWRLDADKAVLTTESYERLGYTAPNGRPYPGVHGAIAKRAEDMWRLLDSEEQPAATRVFLNLAAPGPAVERTDQIATDVSNRALYEELDEPSKRVVDKLTDARLLTKGKDPISQQPTFEVAHEALIRAWPKLQGWVRSYRPFVRWRHNELAPHLRRWLEKEKNQGFLLPEIMVKDALYWLEKCPEELSGPPAEYIRTSEESWKRDKQRWKDLAESETRQRQEAERQRDEAERQRRVAFAGQLAAQAELVGNEGAHFLLRSVLLAVEAMKLSPSLQAEQILRRGLDLMALPISEVHLGDARVEDVCLSADGRYIATVHLEEIDLFTSEVKVWEVASGEEVGRVHHDDFATSVALNYDGRYLATVSQNRVLRQGEVKVWEVVSGEEVGRVLHEGVTSVAFSPDGEILATASEDGTVRVVEIPEAEEVPWVHESPVTDALLVLRSEEESERAHREKQFRGRGDRALKQDVAFSADGKHLVTLAAPRIWRLNEEIEISVWLVTSGEEVRTKTGVTAPRYTGGRKGIAVAGNGEDFATVGGRRTASVWGVASGEEVGRVLHEGVTSVAFSPDGEILATAGEDGTVRVWGVSGGKVRYQGDAEVQSVAVSLEGKYLAIAEAPEEMHSPSFEPSSWTPLGPKKYTGQRQTPRSRSWVRLLEMESGEDVRRVPLEGVRSVALSSRGRCLATASRDGTVIVWEVASGEEVRRIVHLGATSVVFSPDGEILATTGHGTVKVVEITTGDVVARVGQDDRTIISAAFSMDGKHLAIAQNNRAEIMDVPGGEEVARVLYDRVTWVDQVAFSTDRNHLVTAHRDDINVWEVASGEKVARVHPEDLSRVRSPNIVLNPDGKHFAATVRDRKIVRMWEVVSGVEVARVFQGGATHVTFSADGRHLAILGGGIARVVYWRPEDLIQEACNRLTRNLTPQEWSTYFGEQPYRKTCSKLP